MFLIFTFFCVQVIHMLFWGELDLIFTLSSLKVIIVTFWIQLDLIPALFYMQVITMVFWIVLDLISIFVCLASVVSCPKNNKKLTEYVP